MSEMQSIAKVKMWDKVSQKKKEEQGRMMVNARWSKTTPQQRKEIALKMVQAKKKKRKLALKKK